MTEIKKRRTSPALFQLGFRPFFLGASLYAVIIVGLWTGIYAFNVPLPVTGLTVFQWHAHEMIFGYTMAVIAGFLLTATANWTGLRTAHGGMLAVLFFLWVAARLAFLPGSAFIGAAAIFDLLFMLALMGAVGLPIVKAANWRQLGILSKLLLLIVANAAFYLGHAGILEGGMYLGLYGGLYVVTGLVLTMGGRVIPFFIERGVGYPVRLSNPVWITIAGMVVFIIFFISEVFLQNRYITGYASAGLAAVYGIRLTGWHTPGIWKKPLLWSLYAAYVLMVAGFMLFALNAFAGLPKYLAIHMLAYGGIGLITVSMMARVSLGHTGRSVNDPPAQVKYIFILISLGALARVIMPIVNMGNYQAWVVISQLLWISAFLLFSLVFSGMLVNERVDA